jgi:RNA polymerase sigma-70 factor (ECF subfamily)
MKPEEFNTRVIPLSQKLLRLAKRLLSIKEAEDMVQDVMLSLWEKRKELNRIFSIDAYANRMLKNKCLDKLKSHNSIYTISINEGVDKVSDLNSELDNLEAAHIIDEIINSLPYKQRIVVHMREIEGYSMNEIGEVMEMENSAVRANLSRARKKIQSVLIQKMEYGTK